MAGDWTTIVNSTTSQYLKEVEDNIMRARKLLALMQSKGRVSYNEFGKNLDWKVKYKRAPLMGFADGDTVTFARRDRHKTANLDWRGYQLTDLQSKMDRLKNRSNAQIIDLYAGIVDDMLEDIEDQFGDQLYVDGNAAGNGKLLHGIESFLSGTNDPGNPVAIPNDTYGGLSTAPGGYGGSWSATWPLGKGDAHYDFWSPVLANYTSTYWGGSTHTWTTHCTDAMRFLIIKSRRNKTKKGTLDLILLEEDLYRAYLTVQDSSQRIVVNRNEKGGLVSLGFGDVMNLDGVDITSEYGMPASTGYGFNTMQMHLGSMQDRLFVPTGPVFSEESSTYRFLIDFYGNCRFNPRFMGKLYPYS